MGFRTVIIKNRCKLTYQNNCMIVKNDDVTKIFLNELDTLVIDTLLVSITGVLMCELADRNINVILCDERHNPKSRIMPFYSSHNSSKKINIQIKWNDNIKSIVWQEIIIQKIKNQNKLLNAMNIKDDASQYIEEVEPYDNTNREAVYAKRYFRLLFGKNFVRKESNDINSALDFGYTVLLSSVSRSIAEQGYMTQLGIKHTNEFNEFNLSCDLMEAFRPVVDKIVYLNRYNNFDSKFKYKIINIMNGSIAINGKKEYLNRAIEIYIKGIFDTLYTGDINNIVEFEMGDYEE